MTQIAEYRTLVQAKGYDGLASTQLDPAINAGRRRVAKDRRWTWLETVSTALSTVAGNPEVSIASLTDLGGIDAVRLTQSGVEYPLDFLPLQELRDRQARDGNYGATLNSRPDYWSRRNAKLLFYPTPDSVFSLTIEYVAVLADLSGVTEDTIPAYLKDLVVWAAVKDLAIRQRDAWAAQNAEVVYQTLRAAAIAQEATQHRQTSEQVRSGYWGSSR